MAKMKTSIDKNKGNKSNSRGFNAGGDTTEYGPDSVGGGSPAFTNVIGGTPDPNTNKGQTYEKRMITPREPVLNAVSMPNKKAREVNRGVLSFTGSGGGDTAPATVPIGGTPKPNKIS